MKIIYEGQEFKVPKKTKYVAADNDGEVFAFSGPEKLKYSQGGGYYYEGGTATSIGFLNLKANKTVVRFPAVKIKKMVIVTPITNL